MRVSLYSSALGAALCVGLALAVREPLWLVLGVTFVADAFRALGEMERAR